MTTEDTTVPAKCLKCEASLGSPIVCEGCHALYPIPQSADYFDLLGVERCYGIDQAKLTAAFRALTRNIHPDRFSNQPDQVCALSTRLSAELNQAYSVLKDPVQRADYMLEQAGGPSAAQVRAVPGNLLAEVVMLREEVEQARADGNEAVLDHLRSTVTERRRAALQDIAARAGQLDTANDDDKVEFRKLINSVSYFDNLLADLAADPLEAPPEAPHDEK